MKSKALSVVIFILLLFIYAVTGLCQDEVTTGDVVENIGRGTVNWTAGYIEVIGVGMPSTDLVNKPSSHPVAFRAAKKDAERNLLDIIQSVKVDSQTSLKDFIAKDIHIGASIDALVKKSVVIDYKYLVNDVAEIRLRVPLYHELMTIILPLAMEKSETYPTESIISRTAKALNMTTSTTPVIHYTGVIIDARGSQMRPALMPKILDEQGRAVYGTANVDMQWARKEGMIGYTNDMKSLINNRRVKDNPLIIKALKTKGDEKSDLVISNADARQIRMMAEKTSVLKQCKVIVVAD